MTTTFNKTSKIANQEVTTTIILTDGINVKGQPRRHVNFIDTCPSKSFDAAKKFESFEITFEEMVAVLNSDGYTAK